MKRQRKKFTGTEKVAILRQHFLEGAAINDVMWLNDPNDKNSPALDAANLAALSGVINQDFLLQLVGLQGEMSNANSTNDFSAWERDISLANGRTIYRLREGIERFLITDINNPAASAQAQSDVWIYMDDLNSENPEFTNHIPGGGNVLYLDGHVEFLRYPSDTPFSKAWAVLLGVITGAF